MSKETRILHICLLGGGLLAALVGSGLFYNATGRGIPCALYQLTGLQCAGCGLTRAAAALLHLDLTAAFSSHALWPVFVAYFLWVGISDAAVYVKTGDIRLLPGKWWIHAAVTALIVGYGVLRNFL